MHLPFHFNTIDTPHKRVKPNQDSTVTNSNPKISLFQKLNDRSLTKKNPIPAFQVSEFSLPFEYKSSRSEDGERMEEEEINEFQDKLMKSLGRKMTYMDKKDEENMMSTLSLYRNNSTYDQARDNQQLKLGDNIYLREINSHQPPPAVTRFANENEHGSRIQQDYQIQQNLKLHRRKHENYICLSRLQRIFYYVKKARYQLEGAQSYAFLQQMASEQVKIYHKDTEGAFLRFYQSWFEHNALYMTFEVAVTSLQDLMADHQRLREVEAWDLLRDCTRGLSWLYQHHDAHLNIKPGNVLKCQRKFKLADPYLHTGILQYYLNEKGDSWEGWMYLAPEIKRFHSLIQGLDLKKSDIYALGMCLIQNLVGEKYFPREGRLMREYIQKHIHGYSPSLMKTLLRMVSTDPSKRPSVEELCEVEQAGQKQKTRKKRRFSI